ncbi:DHA3 family macrolide efflux protein-like MFS transporter [Nocardioides thalensis]|uniref:DHA3 family macrolide efflux protein-like MFS transporter n=1 Tax=Nocardioides thalensis TaxID=1914755 RepID=A0A853C8L3_9ACTN|nr:MFS transporter [Nocardioides thalensis]NYJ03549.1 DHA3 family macrolide efflux protein-like MFS transporter [Nocardioides thalensis]
MSNGSDNWKRNVLVFLGGQTVSSLGSMIVSYAVMWHLTIETGSAAVLTTSVVASMLPQAVVSVFGGVWADRHSRKLLIIGADSTIAAVTLLLALLMLTGSGDLWMIYLALAARSALAGVQSPAVNAMLPQIVPKEHLMRVNGIQQSISSGIMLFAPALAAAVYASAGIVTVFFIDVVTAVGGVLLLTLVPTTRVVRSGEQLSYFGDLVAGVRYVRGHASVRWVMTLVAVVMFMAGAPAHLTPLMVSRSFGDAVWMLSVNELFWSVGMLLGGAAMATVGPKVKRPMRLMAAASVVVGVLVVGLGVSANFWVFSVLGLVICLGFQALLVPATTVLQERVEESMSGRVFGFYGIVISVAMPLSMVVFGPLADRIAVESVMVLAGVLLLVAVLGMLAAGARKPRPMHPHTGEAVALQPAAAA